MIRMLSSFTAVRVIESTDQGILLHCCDAMSTAGSTVIR